MTRRDERQIARLEDSTPVDAEPLRKILRKLRIANQVQAVMTAHRTSLEQVVSPSRMQGPSRARNWLAFVVRETSMGALSWNDIAVLFRRQDHSTMLYAAKKGERLVPSYGAMPKQNELHATVTGVDEARAETRASISAFVLALADEHFRKKTTSIETVEELQRVAGIIRRAGEERERERWI